MNIETHRPSKRYRYYDLIMAGFVAVLLCSNLIGPAKVCHVFGFHFGAGNLFFPISYIFGDILTEVYGYARSRRVIWAGFSAMAFASVMAWIVIHVPATTSDPFQQELQPALEMVLGNTWRITAASMIAFWVGEFSNSYVLAKMKIFSQGRRLWQRTIGSTLVGQGIDTAVFYPLAFAGIWPLPLMIKVIITNYFLKVGVEVFMTPATYFVVNRLKRAESEDFYDRKTDFTPFSLKD